MAEMLACTERHRAMRSFAFIDTLLRTCGFDPERPAKWARLACVPRDADDEGSDLIDCEGDGLERRQRKMWRSLLASSQVANGTFAVLPMTYLLFGVLCSSCGDFFALVVSS